MVTFTLSQIDNIKSVLGPENENTPKVLKSLKLSKKSWRSNKGVLYNIVRYDKSWLSIDSYDDIGLFRSVITDNDGNILSFSPPKSLHSDRFLVKSHVDPEKMREGESLEDIVFAHNVVAEEFVEGTMVNLFFDKRIGEKGDWEIATRGTVGGNVTFFMNGKDDKSTFRYMFLDACTNMNLDFDKLPKEYCYSFVLQHPKNRIVTPINKESLYLIGIYKCDNEKLTITEMSRDTVNFEDTDVHMPKQYKGNMDELIEKYASMNTSYEIVGVVFRDKTHGFRCKHRNPNYEHVRQLRGNSPKLQYQYLSLRKDGKVKDFLKYYPELRDELNQFRTQMHKFTDALFGNYKRCYVRKEKPLIEFPYQYRTHMYTLHHELYLKELREKNSFISRSVVINYINKLHPAQQMYTLNYNMREQDKDTKKQTTETI